MTFTKRDLVSNMTLGQRFRQLREEQGQSVDDVAKILSIASKYLAAVEDGRYHELPGQVYARSFVRQYAEYLGLQRETVMDRFQQEYRVVAKSNPPHRPLPPARVNTEHPWLRRQGRLVFSLFVFAVVLSYISWQAYRIFVPPQLTVSDPPADITTSAHTVQVSGQSQPEVSIAINGQSVAVNAFGQFSVTIDVSPGINTLVITAKKKHSQPRVVTRRVLVEQ